MRIVLDTNVFVNAVLRRNSLPFLAVCWIDQHRGLLESAITEQAILNELAGPAFHLESGDLPLSEIQEFRDAPRPARRVAHADGQ
jgi:predicted nucleic acid-binding protein